MKITNIAIVLLTGVVQTAYSQQNNTVEANAQLLDKKEIQEVVDYFDNEMKRIEDKKNALEARQRIFEQKQDLYDSQLKFYEAKQLLSESRLEKIQLEAERLDLLQQKANLGKRTIQSELVFPEIRGDARDKLEAQLKDVIAKENEIDQQVSAIDKRMQAVTTFIEKQQQDVDKFAQAYFELRSSIKIVQ